MGVLHTLFKKKITKKYKIHSITLLFRIFYLLLEEYLKKILLLPKDKEIIKHFYISLKTTLSHTSFFPSWRVNKALRTKKSRTEKCSNLMLGKKKKLPDILNLNKCLSKRWTIKVPQQQMNWNLNKIYRSGIAKATSL